MSLSQTRSRTTKALAGLAIHQAFQIATAATEARLLAIPASRRTDGQRKALRRATDKARAIGVVR